MRKLMTILAALALLYAMLLACSVPARAASCSPLRLYDGDGYTGVQVAVWPVGSFVNLGNHGFDRRAESVRNGGCWATLYSGLYGSGAYMDLAPGQWVELSWEWDNGVRSVLRYP